MNKGEDVTDRGSSPHMRGTLRMGFHDRLRLGIIPAYAGNTRDVSTRNGGPRDHPRICGEHRYFAITLAPVSGSSPHMRGTLADQPQATPVDGIIPAYAGNTTRSAWRISNHGDHPRICGEHIADELNVTTQVGSSPHMRGTLGTTLNHLLNRGIIPAYAGNTRG